MDGINIVRYKFFSTVICDILKTVESAAFTGAFTLSFCCIDHMGLAIKPESTINTKTEFKLYLKNRSGKYYSI